MHSTGWTTAVALCALAAGLLIGSCIEKAAYRQGKEDAYHEMGVEATRHFEVVAADIENS